MCLMVFQSAAGNVDLPLLLHITRELIRVDVLLGVRKGLVWKGHGVPLLLSRNCDFFTAFLHLESVHP